MRFSHQSSGVVSEFLPDEHVLLADSVRLWAIGPNLIVGSAAGSRARDDSDAAGYLTRLTVPMEAHHGTKGTPLKPPDEKFAELIVIRVSAMEPADVSCPPGNASDSHARRQWRLDKL